MKRSVIAAGLLLVWLAAILGGADAAAGADGDVDWGVRVQPATPGLSKLYAIYYNRAQARHYYKRVFVLLRREGDPRAGDDLSADEQRAVGEMFKQDVQLMFDMLTKATKEYEAWGCKPASIKPVEIDGKEYLPVIFEDFGAAQRRAAGKVSPSVNADGTLGTFCNLKMNMYLFAKLRVTRRDLNAMAGTTAHELFHAIQYGYVRSGDFWFKESTATWAANQIVAPRLTHDVHMDLYTLHMHRPLTYDDRAAGSILYATLDTDGRPYGAGIFFHFLSKQYPDTKKLVIAAMENCSPAAGNATAIAGISKALGDGAAMGPAFRELFDRFTVGALLADHAPPDCRVIDSPALAGTFVERSRRRNVNVTNPRDLTPLLRRYYAMELRSPETASVTVDFHAAPVKVEGRKYLVSLRTGEVTGCAARYYLFTKPEGAPDDVSLDAVVKAPESDVSVQGLWNDNGTWRRIKGAYSAEAAGHSVRVPCGRSKDSQVFLVVTRYSEDERAVTYPMTLAMVEPPSLKRVEVTQKSGALVVLKSEWRPQLDPAGNAVSRTNIQTGTGKLDAKGGDAIVLLEFTSPVKAGGKPICTFDGRELLLAPTANDTVFEAGIPPALFAAPGKDYKLVIAARAKLAVPEIDLPLDADASTIARLKPGLTEWTGYERERDIELTLRPTRPVDFQYNSIQWMDLKKVNGETLTLVYGEVKNTGDVTANNPMFDLKGSSFNKSRFPLGTGLIRTSIIEPGAVAPFMLWVMPDNKKDNYEFALDQRNIHVFNKPINRTDLALVDVKVELSWEGGFVPPQPMARVLCRVMNRGKAKIPEGSESITVTYYDEAGKIIGAGGESRHAEGIEPGKEGVIRSAFALLIHQRIASYQVLIGSADYEYQQATRFTPGTVGLAVEGVTKTPMDGKVAFSGVIRNTGKAAVLLARPVFISTGNGPNMASTIFEWPLYLDEQSKVLAPGATYPFTRSFDAAAAAKIHTVAAGADLKPTIEPPRAP
jgi:hypothetical protein